MKTLPRLLPLILVALLLPACGGDVDITPTEGASISDVYTAVVMTLEAQDSLVTPTIMLLPSATPTTLPKPTFISNTPTVQNVGVSYSTANGCYNAAYVSDVTIPDGTILAPGEEFTKTWKFQNTGSCDWTEDFLITFSSGEDMDGSNTEIDEDVIAGDAASISVSLVAPDDEGSYTGYWKLATEDGTLFGETVFVLIVVSDGAATATPTSTATATSTEEDTSATNTPTSTSTPTPSSTPTHTPTPVSDEASDSTSQETSTPETET